MKNVLAPGLRGGRPPNLNDDALKLTVEGRWYKLAKRVETSGWHDSDDRQIGLSERSPWGF